MTGSKFGKLEPIPNAHQSTGGLKNRPSSAPAGHSWRPITVIAPDGRKVGSSVTRRGGGGLEKAYLETLTLEQCRSLDLIFYRVDSDSSGYVKMEDFLARLAKGKQIDPFLRVCHDFLYNSVSPERRQGFKSFRDIVTLLLPTLNTHQIEDILQSLEARKKADARYARKKSVSAPLQRAQRRISALGGLRGSHRRPSEQPEDGQANSKISLSNFIELKRLFQAVDVRHGGSGTITVEDFEHYFKPVQETLPSHIYDIQKLFDRHGKVQQVRDGVRKTTLDFEGFLDLMLPTGFVPCTYPAPSDSNTGSSEDVFRWLHSQPCRATESTGKANSNVKNSDDHVSKRISSRPEMIRPLLPPSQMYSLRTWHRTPLDSRTLK